VLIVAVKVTSWPATEELDDDVTAIVGVAWDTTSASVAGVNSLTVESK
jgi:hypothetical protein